MVETADEYDSESELPPKRSKLFQFMGNTPIARITSTLTEDLDAVMSKVEAYLDTPCLPEDTDPIEYWKSQQGKQPHIWLILHGQYLSSSDPVEWLLFVAGKVFRQDRCRLADTLFEKLMFIGCNQKL
jgi:hypothetical protein